MPSGEKANEPDNTAVRTALWRALHVEIDAPPHVFEDVLGLALADPPPGWRERGDMHPEGTRRNRASIVARARFIEDLVEARSAEGLDQYVILGAGLDTFAQRRPELASRLTVYELDQPATQAWKRGRLADLGHPVSAGLRLVAFDFDSGGSWLDALAAAGFDKGRPAVFASTGVSMYISKAATLATMRLIAGLAPGTTLAMTFIPPLDAIDPAGKAVLTKAMRGARAQGTPFVSFYTPDEMLALAREAGFGSVQHVSSQALAERYFAGRRDGLSPAGGEEMLVAGV